MGQVSYLIAQFIYASPAPEQEGQVACIYIAAYRVACCVESHMQVFGLVGLAFSKQLNVSNGYLQPMIPFHISVQVQIYVPHGFRGEAVSPISYRSIPPT